MSSSARFFHTHKRTLLALIFGLAFSATLAYAVPPGSQYTPAQTLDPVCAPGDANCSVDISGTGAAWGLITGTLSTQTDLQSALDGKFDDPSGTTSQYIRGDGTLATYTGGTQDLQSVTDIGATTTADVYVNSIGIADPIGTYSQITNFGNTLTISSSNGDGSGVNFAVSAGSIALIPAGGATSGTITAPSTGINTYNLPDASGYLALSVNGIASDSTGNITISTGGAWGTITGTLSDQTDLQSALDGKFDDPSGTTSQYIRGDGTLATFAAVTSLNSLTTATQTFATGASGIDFGISSSGSTHTFNLPTASATNRGALSSADWTTFNNKGTVSSVAVSGSGALSFTGGPITSSGTISVSWGGTTAEYVRGDGSLATYNPATYTFSTGLTNTSGTITSNLSTGISGGQSVVGGTASGNNLTLSSTTNATKGKIVFGTSAYDEVNNRLGIGTASPTTTVDIRTSAGSTPFVISNGIGATYFQVNAVRDTTLAIGASAGTGATSASQSVFLGTNAGDSATSASNSNFIGQSAGYTAINAQGSNFMGRIAGSLATNAHLSNFFGDSAGVLAVNAGHSNFFGANAGAFATNAANSFFVGQETGSYNSTFNTGSPNAANSIFIGTNAGALAGDNTLDNTAAYNELSTFANTSILIGHRTSTAGYSNSIAIGAYAANTAANQFVIGSTTRPIDTTIFYGTGGTSCTITTGTSMSCSSDERLKTNIADLTTTTLDTLLNVRTVTYNWNATPDGKQMVGFVAQDLQQYFPQLVSTGPGDYLQVNYAGITPILVEAIREMNLKIVDISDLTKDNSWRSALVAWLGNATNGIQSIFSKEVHTDTLCVKKSDGSELCLTGDQLQSALNGQGNTIIMPPPPTPTPDPVPTPDPAPIPDPVPEIPTSEPIPESAPVADPAPEISTPETTQPEQ